MINTLEKIWKVGEDVYNYCNERGRIGVSKGEYPVEFAEVKAYLAEHPEALIDEPVPPPPSPEDIKSSERRRIIAALEAIDRKAIRPLRALAAGSTSEMDRALVEELETEAEALRAELAKL